MDNLLVPVIQTNDLIKTYKIGEVEVHALAGVSVTINKGEVVAIMGPSGSGKSTLMNLLGCLDRPTSGRYILDGEEVSELDDDQLAGIVTGRWGSYFRVSIFCLVQLPWQTWNCPCATRVYQRNAYSGQPKRSNQ
jgi:predicted ABC-type transport system involved in lysophospholipase L1 biosynthesis ATPase subunit